jgi:hypothetical protein
MALPATGIDFSAEAWDTAVEFFEGCGVVANRHSPGLNKAMELNNRAFVFRLQHAGEPTLLVFGVPDASAIEAVEALAARLELPVGWVVSNGGAHHLFLDLWYQAFPDARVLVPAKRIPFTRNGAKLQEKYADRWELMEGPHPDVFAEAFGDQIDCVVFDQLFGYRDQKADEIFDGGAALDHESKPINVGGFGLMMKFMKLGKELDQPNDEVFLFHRASGLVIAGHNFQFIYKPKGYKPEPEFKMKSGGFPVGLMMSMMMPKGAFKSALEGQAAPIADSAVHAATWDRLLDWDIKAWTSPHDPPRVSGPDLDGDAIKQLIRESLQRSGEDDPTGARLKWNIKNPKAG